MKNNHYSDYNTFEFKSYISKFKGKGCISLYCFYSYLLSYSFIYNGAMTFIIESLLLSFYKARIFFLLQEFTQRAAYSAHCLLVNLPFET